MNEKKQFKKMECGHHYENIKTVGNLKKVLNGLKDDLPIECTVHKLGNVYIIKEAYLCVNMVEEPILQLEIKTDWDLTERDEKTFEEWCKSQEDKE